MCIWELHTYMRVWLAAQSAGHREQRHRFLLFRCGFLSCEEGANTAHQLAPRVLQPHVLRSTLYFASASVGSAQLIVTLVLGDRGERSARARAGWLEILALDLEGDRP